jgi:uncharacterized protein (TIGR04255 family)
MPKMAKQRHLNNAPITEAVIDLRIKPVLGDEVLPMLSSVKNEIGDSYPVCKEFRSVSGEIELEMKSGKSTVNTAGMAIEGYIYRNDDKKQIAQFRRNGFTFNKLNPYTRWEDILVEAQRLWLIYLEKTSPEIVTRIAVRYINKLDIPLPEPEHDLSEYLTEPPKIPDELNYPIDSCFSKIVLHDDKTDLLANMIQSINANVDHKTFTLILDNDVYKQGAYKASDPNIWRVFSQLRDLENALFFASITEKTARLFE